MIGGVTNVGKSNIINGLRIRSKSFKTNSVQKSNNRPCLTTAMTGFVVSKTPLIYMLDTPGILPPQIDTVEKGLKLSLLGSVKGSIASKRLTCEYFHYTLQ